MKKVLFYLGCFVLGCLTGHFFKNTQEQQIEPPFDNRLLDVLSEYEEQ